MATYYVSTTGNNSSAGTISAPFLTSFKVATVVAAGDTVFYRGGTYTGPTNAIDTNLITVASGTNFTTGAITFAAYPGETVILQPGAGTGNILDLESQQYLIFDGLILDGTGIARDPSGGGLYVGPTAQHIRFQNGEIRNCVGQGVNSSHLSPGDCQILNSHIHHNGQEGSPQSHNIYFTNSGNTITGNTIDHAAYCGIQIYDSDAAPSNNVITGNNIFENCLFGVAEVFVGGSGSGNLISNNLIHSSSSVGYGFYQDFGTISSTHLYNNTIVHDSAIRIGSGSGTLITNNILRNATNTGAGTFEDSGTGTVRTTNLTSDPLFVNASIFNYHLTVSSPAIGAGTTLGLVPVDSDGVAQTAPYAIGAFRYQATPITTTTTITAVTPSSPTASESYTVDVTVAPTAGTSVPTGPVTVNDGAGTVTTIPVSPAGTVTVPMVTPDAGSVTVTVTYGPPPVSSPPFSPSQDTAPVTVVPNPMPPPPTNLTALTATDLGTTLPASVTQTVEDSGTTYTVWYSYTAQPGDHYVGLLGFGGLGAYQPELTVFVGPASAPVEYLGGFLADNIPIQFPVTPGTTYYFQFDKQVGNPSPAELTVSLEAAPTIAAPTGALMICDFNGDFRMAGIIHPTTGDILRYEDVPDCDFGDILPNGTMGLIANTSSPPNIVLVNGAFQEIASVAGLSTHLTFQQIRGDGHETFFVGDSTASVAATVKTVSLDGTVGATTWTLPANSKSLRGMAPAWDQSILYYGSLNAGSAVYRYDLDGDAPLSDLAAAIANYSVLKDILITADGSILVAYHHSAGTSDQVIRYSPAGAVLHTYSLGGTFRLDRIALDRNDANFWVWSQASPLGRFQQLRLSDGAELEAFDVPLFTDGLYEGTPETDPPRFGVSNSCPFIVLRSSTPTTQTVTIRRQRRFLLPSSPNNTVMQIPTIELLMLTGIGVTPEAWGSTLPVGAVPQVMFRLSKDGGKTWSPERWVSAGELGQYRDRVRLLRATGNYRNAVLEVTVSDPVDWGFLAALGTPVEGLS